MRARLTQEERRNEAEIALMDAAAELFAQQGVEKTTSAAICERAGYSHGLINHHFGSKAALVERLAERSQNDFVNIIDGFHQENRATPPGDMIKKIAGLYIDTYASPSAKARCFLVMWGAAFVENSSATFAKTDQRFRVGIAALVNRGISSGSVPETVDSEAFAAALLALVRGYSAQMLVSPDAVDAESARQQCLRFIDASLSL